MFPKKSDCTLRHIPVRKYWFLGQKYRKFNTPTKLRSTLKLKFRIKEKEKPCNKADAYYRALTSFCAESSCFKAILPCGYVACATAT